jgi:hypothetical protein
VGCCVCGYELQVCLKWGQCLDWPSDHCLLNKALFHGICDLLSFDQVTNEGTIMNAYLDVKFSQLDKKVCRLPGCGD